ncbi:hypothetical protein TNCT_7791 [Trichonephila clavata]|uniref:C2H2-type domain-containing protein n=1 Tax=Trichonephila clavata TaxID=2740835 RepID=A0A8X6M0X4_TRICU|nr:hypothetical protein TNCT_7791 [Trichonephila clavata]
MGWDWIFELVEKLHKILNSYKKIIQTLGNFPRTKQTIYACSFCSYTTQHKSHMDKHVRVHTKERPFICMKYCGNFQNTFEPDTEYEEANYQCSMCPFSSPMKHILNKHVQTHSKKYTFACEVCYKRFQSNRDLEVHHRSHSGERPFVCTICNCGNFQNTFEPDTEYEEANYQCFMCPFSSPMKHILNKHMQTHSKKYTCACEVCYKRFQSNRDLEVHHRRHSGERPFVCTICSKGFSHKGNYKKHLMSSHNLLYQCKICNKNLSDFETSSFEPTDNLYICSFCSYSTSDVQKLEIHVELHSREFHFVCNICGEKYPSQTSLNVHFRAHSKEAIYDCLSKRF